MYNMITEDGGVMNLEIDHKHEISSFILVSYGETPKLHDIIQTYNRIRDKAINC